MARTCVFCGDTPLTKEHVLPQWLERAFEPSMLPRSLHIRLTEHSAPRHHEAPLLTGQVRIVCTACNSGWMNDLEEAVRSFLPALISGRPAQLTGESQHALAAWSLKTMLMYQYTQGSEARVVIPTEDYTSFFLDRQPSRLMIARMGYMNYPPDDSIPLVDSLNKRYGDTHIRAWIGTLKVGCLVVQVLRAPVDDGQILAPFPASDALSPIWPPVATPAAWPPPVAVPYDDFEELAHPETLDATTLPA